MTEVFVVFLRGGSSDEEYIAFRRVTASYKVVYTVDFLEVPAVTEMPGMFLDFPTVTKMPEVFWDCQQCQL